MPSHDTELPSSRMPGTPRLLARPATRSARVFSVARYAVDSNEVTVGAGVFLAHAG